MSRQGIVYLIGAGPGDPELITLRGARLIASADVVFCDALLHPDWLRRCGADVEVRFVGKRAGVESPQQQEINRQLIDAARGGKVVVRLKGGDPLLFGRGTEEAEALADAGIAFEIVPGVASAIAAGAYAGTALTHRHLSASVAFLTATESPDREGSHDWARLATATDTLVIFMGTRKIASLMRTLIEHGRDPETPACLVHAASLPTQRVVCATLATLEERVRDAGVGAPGLIVIGEVLSLRKTLDWYGRRPLFGKKVLVTRPEGQAAAFVQSLRDLGAEPIEWPAIRIAPPEDRAELMRAVSTLSDYDWVVFTSANGVHPLLEEVARQGFDARKFGDCRIAAIGPKTSDALRSHGLRADLVPTESRGEGIAAALLGEIADPAAATILLPRAEVARDVLPDTLRAAGARVDIVTAYRTVGADPATLASLRERIMDGQVDIATFTSPSTVEQFLNAIGGAAHLPKGICIASIGPITTARAIELGMNVDLTAEPFTTDGLLRALTDHHASLDPPG